MYRLSRSLRVIAPLCFATLIACGCTVSPKPFASGELASKAQKNLDNVTADQEPITGPISLYEATARALKYNLDHRVERVQAALRNKELDFAHFSLLPNVVANSGYAARNNFNASNSVNILTGNESLAVSTSQDRRILTADIAFSWNVLDFGLSYVRAQQASDKYLIAKEMRRKIVHRVVEDVRTAYWRAVSAERLVARLRRLERRARRAQVASRAIAKTRRSSPITATTYERELVDIKRKVQELQRDLSIAKSQLASLMNLKPGTKFGLAPGSRRGGLRLRMNVKTMIWRALNNRAELRDVWYRRRINERELDAALLELLPGLTPYAGTNFDSNDFLFHSNWLSWGAKASWNLIRIFQYPAKEGVINAQDRLLKERGLAVTMAVMTQVHVSRVRFLQASKELATAREYRGVQKRLVRLIRAEKRSGRISEQTLIREELNTLVAEAKFDIAYAGLQNAYANVYASMGLDPFGTMMDYDLDVQTLARRLRNVWRARGDGGADSWVKRVASR